MAGNMGAIRTAWTIGRSGEVARWLAAVVFCLAAVLFVVAAPAAALAHAALVSTEPADGAVLTQSPARFALTFSEPVSPLVLTLVRPDGTAVPLTSFRLNDQTVEIDNPKPLGKGTHVLSYRVISADGHPVGGSILFSVGAVSAAPPVSEPVDWALRSAIWLAKVWVRAAGVAFSLVSG